MAARLLDRSRRGVMVPSSLGCGSTVFAAMTTFAPSLAARSAIANPIPREPPVMKSVLSRRPAVRMAVVVIAKRRLWSRSS
jgi:hypothetical protein